MITAIIETRDDEVRLAHVLAALVPAATEGVLRDVVVIDRGSRDGTLIVADAAGCTIVAAREDDADVVRRAAGDARGEWLLFLSPSAVLSQDWQGEAVGFIDEVMVAGLALRRVAVFRKGRLVAGWRRWLALASGAVDVPRAGEARLISKSAYLARVGLSSSSSPVSAASSASGARRGAA